MAEIIRLPIAHRDDVSAHVDVRSDDFAIKVSSPADGLFWVRIELPVRDEIVVSDFNPGRLGDEVLIAGLLRAVDGIASGANTFVFRDVAPGPANPRSGLLISAARTRIEKAAERLARQRRLKVHRVSLEEHRGKVNVRVELS